MIDDASAQTRLARAIRWLGGLGTAGYPPRTARRLAILNVLVVLAVAGTSAYIPAYALYDYAGLWPVIWVIVAQNVLMLCTPWFHRFGETAGALWFIAVWFATVAFYSYSFGRGPGIHFYFLPGAAATLIFLGIEHRRTAIAATVLAIALLMLFEVVWTEPAPYMRVDPVFATVVRAVSIPIAYFFVFIGVFYGMWLATTAEDALEREYARSERLLDNLLPESIAERLKNEPERIIADDLGQVTILFADIVDFTPRAAQLRPPELVAFLNRVFTEFDRLAERLRLEKIKTIGDAYMVAGGMPEPRPDHAEAVAEMALEMIEATGRIAQERGEDVSVRVGLHTGPAVAGVIGTRKFFYDVWGDTVNTAARMESHGEPGRIQVTEEARAALADAYTFEPRGEIEIKGKGRIRTWWLTGRRTATADAA